MESFSLGLPTLFLRKEISKLDLLHTDIVKEL